MLSLINSNWTFSVGMIPFLAKKVISVAQENEKIGLTPREDLRSRRPKERCQLIPTPRRVNQIESMQQAVRNWMVFIWIDFTALSWNGRQFATDSNSVEWSCSERLDTNTFKHRGWGRTEEKKDRTVNELMRAEM